MGREIVAAADALLDVETRVLDKGFVRLVDYMGGDSRVVQSARVSYGAGTKTVREDRGLINYLMKNQHASPFEQVILTFHLKMPIFVARQVVRHRTARMNEISGRYSVMRDEFYVPAPERMARQSRDNKQGSGEAFHPEDAQLIVDEITADQAAAYARYTDYVDSDVARELARINLPLSLYTECYWQIDLRNLMHFLGLRLDAHAQYEVRVYAEAMMACARAVAPMCVEAFEEHVLHGVRLSREELTTVRAMLMGGQTAITDKGMYELDRKLGMV